MKKSKFRRLIPFMLILIISIVAFTGCDLLDDEDDYYYVEHGNHHYDDDWDDDDWDDDDWYDDWDDDDWYDDWDDDDWYDDDDDYYYYDDDDYYGGSNGGSSYNGGSSHSSNSNSFSKIGSAGELDGTTLIVSIYTDDKTTSWTSSDSALKNRTLKYTGMATSWIATQVSSYGCDATFIYDWSKKSDLEYKFSTNTNMITDDESIDYVGWEYIEDNIDSEGLMDKYNADNIIYLFFINSPSSNYDVVSCTRNYYAGMDYPYEMCFMYMHSYGEEESPAAFAHEILHTFGAPDLYSADQYGDNYGITQQYVNQLEASYSNDIMFTTYDAYTQETYYDKITNEFTEIDAYYVGVTDYSSDVDSWGFDESEH